MLKVMRGISLQVVQNEDGDIVLAVPLDMTILTKDEITALAEEAIAPQPPLKEWTYDEIEEYLEQKDRDEFHATLAYYTVLSSHSSMVKKESLLSEMGELFGKKFTAQELTGVLASVTRGTINQGMERLDKRDKMENAEEFGLNEKYRDHITNALGKIMPFGI